MLDTVLKENDMKESEHLRINEKKWDKWAKTIDSKSLRNNYLRSAQLAIISVLDLKENISMLDIGCGSGWALDQASKLVKDKGTFFGVDLSAKMIEKARENFKERENFHFIIANAEEIPLEDNTFEVITCTNSFHHYLHPEKALKEMYRLLKPGGKIYILDPTIDNWFFKIISAGFKIFDRAQAKLYSTKEFQEMISGAGMKYTGTKKIKMQKIHTGMK
jgi:ubiquinone/menaquinone biosynthesis C-methylase UbiE